MNIRQGLLAGALVLCTGAARAQGTATGTPQPINGPGSTLSKAPRPKVPHSPKLPYGLQLMALFDLLPVLRDTRCVQDSSYDRSGGNGDAGHFLSMDGDTAVLADIRGPGCIYRFWSANATGDLRIYFDGETTPRIACPMQDLFLGKVAPFVAPLVGHKSGGWYCFFPMPFAKSCRIEVTHPGGMYYHVQYQLFPDGTPVRTFTRELTSEDQTALDTILEQWKQFGSDPNPPVDSVTNAIGHATLAPGETKTIATLIGPGEVSAFRMQIAPADRFTLRQTALRVYWDGDKKPGIEAPVGDFFGAGFGDQRFQALPCAMTDDGYICFWPMPFAHAARVELTNTGPTPLTDVNWNIATRPLKKPLTDAGYFHAQWHRQTTVAGEPFHILHTTGRGHYVGVHLDMQGDRGLGFLEGDEMISVDGESFPSIHGTGTEDFFTGGWYFDEGTFNLAYHGCVLKRDEMSRVSAYRYQIQDCVPFQREIKVDIEHGGVNDYPGADYACVAYWYQTTPDHAWSPVQTAQLTPARMKVGYALEAEDVPWVEGNVPVVDDRNLPDEASGGKVVALPGGEHTFKFDIKNDDVYDVGLWQPVAPGTTRLLARFWIDDDRLDPSLLPPDEGVLDKGERSSAHRTHRFLPGPHTVTISVPQGKTLYLDYITLGASWKEEGVTEAEGLLDKADVADRATLKREDTTFDWSGASALVWTPKEVGATLKLPISVPADTDYALELGVTRNPGGMIVAAKVDDGDTIGSLDTYAAQVNQQKPTDRLLIGRIPGLKKGDHTLTLIYQGRSAGTSPPALMLDYFSLHKSLYPNSLEAESLKVLDAKDGEATTQAMAPFGADWSNDNQFWFLGQKEGAEATLELPVVKAGIYNLSVYYTTSRDYAIVQVLVDGQPVGSPTDTYSEPVKALGKTELGTVMLTAGPHRITFRAVGRNPKSTNYLIGVDAIGLDPAP